MEIEIDLWTGTTIILTEPTTILVLKGDILISNTSKRAPSKRIRKGKAATYPKGARLNIGGFVKSKIQVTLTVL